LQPNDILANFIKIKVLPPPLVVAHTLLPPSTQQGEEAVDHGKVPLLAVNILINKRKFSFVAHILVDDNEFYLSLEII
jgi:hypothetical protein